MYSHFLTLLKPMKWVDGLSQSGRVLERATIFNSDGTLEKIETVESEKYEGRYYTSKEYTKKIVGCTMPKLVTSRETWAFQKNKSFLF